jgi:hypothetical protein
MRSAGQREGATNAGTTGAVFVEFLIVFLPVLTMFLCLVQLALLYAVRITVENAAVNAARTAAVVIGDKPDPNVYSGTIENANEIRPPNGARYLAIRRAAVLSLAPFIINGTITGIKLEFPPPDQRGGADQRIPRYTPMQDTTVNKVRVRLEVDAFCKIGLADRIMCRGPLGLPGMFSPPGVTLKRTMRAEAIFPYQGARYTYP